jgi:hypothetical protein
MIFSIHVDFKVEWKQQKTIGAIVAKSGMHMGVFVHTGDGKYFIIAQIWVIKNSKKELIQCNLQIPKGKENEIHKVKLIHYKNEKTISLNTNWGDVSAMYDEDIIDYSDSWLWVGCANGHETITEKHNNYFHGDIFHLSIYNKVYVTEKNKTVAVFYTDFLETTDYKIRDESDSGIHLVKFNKDWI